MELSSPRGEIARRIEEVERQSIVPGGFIKGRLVWQHLIELNESQAQKIKLLN
jgi:hypothetical protein